MKNLFQRSVLIAFLVTGIFRNAAESDLVQGKDAVSQQSIEWESQMAEDYFQLAEWQDMVKQSIFTELVGKYQCEGEDSFQLIDTCLFQDSKGNHFELYLIKYRDRLAKDPTWGIFYSGILVDYDQNTSEVLFKEEKDNKLGSLGGEFYDMQAADLDGNGEEDIIILLGEHKFQGDEYWLPYLYCLVGLQKEGKFQFIDCNKERWLDEILFKLYKDKEEDENWKVQNILESLKDHFNNTKSDKETDNEKTLEDYILKKEEIIAKRIDHRSLFMSREVLWEYLYVNEDNQIRKIMVCAEDGEPGFAPVGQISVYVYDYQTEEAEKQIVPDIYEDICDEYGFSTEIELENLIYEDQNGDGKKDIAITVVATNGEKGKDKKQSEYKIVYYGGSCQQNDMKIFTKVSVTEIKDK